jgi:hypothetical protein
VDLSDYQDWLFRGLDEEEINDFRQWAFDHYEPGSEIRPYWHPVVRRECERINERRDNEAVPGEERQLQQDAD